MVREVAFTQSIHTRNGCHQVIIYPKAAHCVVDCRVNTHWNFIWVLACNLFIHLEQVAIFITYTFLTETLNSISKVKVGCLLRSAYAKTCITPFLNSP